jgi:membrane-associated phospholipid phosphatase
MKHATCALSCLALILATKPAAATEGEGEGGAPTVDVKIDGAALAASLVGALVFDRLSVHDTGVWERQLLPIDDGVKGNYSSRAHTFSNVTWTGALTAPMVFDVARGVDWDTVRRTAIYGEAIAVNLALYTGIKHVVGRPRPYTYSEAADVQDYAVTQGNDARQSFFSGHSSTTFTAAVSGSWLYAQSSPDVTMRTAVWATSLTLASATADLRVRAGKHFPSDVLTGAAIGTLIGYGIPRLHYWGRKTRSLTTPEWIAIVVAPIAGAILGQVLPLESRP